MNIYTICAITASVSFLLGIILYKIFTDSCCVCWEHVFDANEWVLFAKCACKNVLENDHYAVENDNYCEYFCKCGHDHNNCTCVCEVTEDTHNVDWEKSLAILATFTMEG